MFRRIQALQPKNARAVRALREIYAQSGDFAALEALYVEQGAFGDLCDQLTSLADRTADMAARTRLLERVAPLSLEKLNQPERALKAYERILATDPQNRSAALALVPLYRDGAEVAAPARDLRGAARAGGGRRRRRRSPSGWSSAPRRGGSASSAWLEVAGLPVVRARLRGGAQERGRAHRPRAPGRRGRRVGRAGGAVRRARGGVDRTPRSGCGCCAGRCASPRPRLYKPQDARRPPSTSSPRSATTTRPTPRSSRS